MVSREVFNWFEGTYSVERASTGWCECVSARVRESVRVVGNGRTEARSMRFKVAEAVKIC